MPDGIPRVDYHSALKPPVSAKPRQHWTDGSSTALVHDVATGRLPDVYKTCDVLYADLPWQAGFPVFASRARMPGKPTYKAFMVAVSTLVEAETRPVYLVTGQHAGKLLPQPAQLLPTRLAEQPSLIFAYNVKPTRQSFGVAQELLRALALEFERVGDFCCGYGGSARMFRRQGKTFVASDVNPECVGYIAEHAGEWSPNA